MAAPSFIEAYDAGRTDAGGAWFAKSSFHPAGDAGKFVVLQILQDGTTGGAVALTGSTGFNAVDGTADSLTFLGAFSGGGLIQHLWLGRLYQTASAIVEGTNSTSEDLYIRMYHFQDVNTGTTLASVLEQNGTTTPSTASGTSNTIADAGVTTTGVDRLACNWVAVNDDNALDAFTGMTGGTWAEAVAEYAESSGTDGAIGLQTATMATAGTIDGGTDTMAASDGWGVVGFALIGTTAATAYAPVPPNRSQSVLLRL